MHERHHVGRLNVMNLKKIFSRPGRLNLIRITVVVQKRLPLRVETRVLVTERNDHRLFEVELKGNQTNRLRRILHGVDESEAGTVLNGPLRQTDKVLADRKPRTIFRIINATRHLFTDFAAIERDLNNLGLSHSSPPAFWA